MGVQRRFLSLSIILSLLILLAACGQSEEKSSAPKTTPSTPSPTVPKEEMQTTCPTAGKARTAIMPAMPADKQENLIYASQSNATNVPYNATTLLRYNITTTKTTMLVQGNIAQRALSPDGQWIALTINFQDQNQNQWAIQLLRIDGQQLQTLYCAPYFSMLQFSPDQHSLVFVQTGPHAIDAKPSESVSGELKLLDLASGKLRTAYSGSDLANPLFSPDQHFLAFTEAIAAKNQPDSGSSALIIDILDLTTGKVHTVMSSRQPGFPSLSQGQTSATQSSTALFSALHKQGTEQPLAGDWNSLSPLQWAGNTGLFVFLAHNAAPSSVLSYYLLHDVKKDASQQQSNLQYVAANDRLACNSLALMPDGQRLVCSHGAEIGQPIPASVDIRPIAGGKSSTIYHGPVGNVTVNIISNSTLLITQLDAKQSDTLWKVNTDGSGSTRLMAAPSIDWRIQSPISNGSLYALTTIHLENSNETDLLVGSLNGGSPTTIAKASSDTLELIGWTSRT